jgi:putative MATE family efflux protein
MALGVVGANFCFRGFYNGIGKSSVYLVSIVVIQVLNVFFNWVFIYGNLGAAPMEVRGAALASVLAAVIGTCFYCFLTLTQTEVRAKYRPFRLSNLNPAGIGGMFTLSWPEAVRGVGVLASFLLFLELHESVSTTGLAAGAILVNLGSAGFLPARGMGLAGATMVGRHLGRGEPSEARKMVWLGVRLTGFWMLLLGALLAWFADPLLAVFTPDAATLAVAKPALLLIALVAVIDTLPVVLMYSLLGAGSTRWVAVVQLVQQYVVMLPLAWYLGLRVAPAMFPDQEAMHILGLWLGLGISRSILGVIAIARFQGRKWESISI